MKKLVLVLALCLAVSASDFSQTKAFRSGAETLIKTDKNLKDKEAMAKQNHNFYCIKVNGVKDWYNALLKEIKTSLMQDETSTNGRGIQSIILANKTNQELLYCLDYRNSLSDITNVKQKIISNPTIKRFLDVGEKIKTVYIPNAKKWDFVKISDIYFLKGNKDE